MANTDPGVNTYLAIPDPCVIDRPMPAKKAKRSKRKGYSVQCRRCGGKWLARSPQPARCCHCQTRDWDRPTISHQAEQVVLSVLTRGPKPPAVVFAAGDRAGLTRDAIRAAAKRLGVAVVAVTPGRAYEWRLRGQASFSAACE